MSDRICPECREDGCINLQSDEWEPNMKCCICDPEEIDCNFCRSAR